MAGFYNRKIMPRLIAVACSHSRVSAQRERVVPAAEGVVVELGIGSGRNLKYYDREKVERVIGVDPAPVFWELGRHRYERTQIEVELIEGRAEALTLPDKLADTVVVTYTLCSVDDAVAALAEARRVLKPSGRLLFVEHGLAPDDFIAAWQRRMTPMTRTLAGGCCLDRNAGELIRAAGFSFERLDTDWVFRYFPRLASFHYSGIARPA